jgi:hypothetical protein
MAVTAYFYSNGLAHLLTRLKDIDFDTNTIKVMLTTNSYTPNQDTHEDKADVTNEVTGTGYTAGGETLAGKSVTVTNNAIAFDSNNVSWSSSTITARRAVIYDDSGATDADKALIGWIDFGEDKSSLSSTFQITFASAGIGVITAANASGFP